MRYRNVHTTSQGLKIKTPKKINRLYGITILCARVYHLNSKFHITMIQISKNKSGY